MSESPREAVLQAFDLHKRYQEGRGADALEVSVLRGVNLTVQRARARARCCTCWAGWTRPAAAAWS
jgi:hypothetical protein